MKSVDTYNIDPPTGFIDEGKFTGTMSIVSHNYEIYAGGEATESKQKVNSDPFIMKVDGKLPWTYFY
jgi:hypothetical protein